MTRISSDEYRTIEGKRILWNGYDYERQYWVFEGNRDTRTLEELADSYARYQYLTK